MEDIVEFSGVVARYEQATELYRVLGFGDRISDVIVKLISKGKQLEAIKFIFEFGLTDKFPPVLVLSEYVESSKKLVANIHEEGSYSFDSKEEARTKEVRALKSAIEIITVHELESEYPKENLDRRLWSYRGNDFHQVLLPSLGSSPTKRGGVEASVLELLPDLVWHQFQGLMLLPHQQVLHFGSLIDIHQVCCLIILL